jgi:hypothetical protein
MTVDMASSWKRVIAGGERPVRVLLLGLGGRVGHMDHTRLSSHLCFGCHSRVAGWSRWTIRMSSRNRTVC